MFDKIKLIFQKASKGLKHWFYELTEEIYVIIRNRNYAKKHPNLFAIFSIIEQEQNTQIYELQKENFAQIKTLILHDKNIANSHILEALRGLFHNNKLKVERDSVKEKIAHHLFNKSKNLIDENNSYYAPLLKVILFSFPFLLNESNYFILRKLIRKKSRNSLHLIKDFLDDYERLEFLLKLDDIFSLMLASIAFDNKAAFMLFVRFLRRKEKICLIFKDKNFILRTKIFARSGKYGYDFAAVLIPYYEDDFLQNGDAELLKFFKEIFSSEVAMKERNKRYYRIRNYISLNKKLGYRNSMIEQLVKDNIQDIALGRKSKKQFLRMKKLQENFFKIKIEPRVKVKVRAIVNLTNQHAEEHWLMEFAPYLV